MLHCQQKAFFYTEICAYDGNAIICWKGIAIASSKIARVPRLKISAILLFFWGGGGGEEWSKSGAILLGIQI